MSLPPNFACRPGEDLHHYFRKICIEFKKTIQSSQDPDSLELQMQMFINTSKNVNWHQQPQAVYRKPEGEKAVEKVWTEFKRYVNTLKTTPEKAKSQDLLVALDEVERLIKMGKAS